MTNPTFKELEKRKQEQKEIEERIKMMLKSQKTISFRHHNSVLSLLSDGGDSPVKHKAVDNYSPLRHRMNTRLSILKIRSKHDKGLPPLPKYVMKKNKLKPTPIKSSSSSSMVISFKLPDEK